MASPRDGGPASRTCCFVWSRRFGYFVFVRFYLRVRLTQLPTINRWLSLLGGASWSLLGFCPRRDAFYFHFILNLLVLSYVNEFNIRDYKDGDRCVFGSTSVMSLVTCHVFCMNLWLTCEHKLTIICVHDNKLGSKRLFLNKRNHVFNTFHEFTFFDFLRNSLLKPRLGYRILMFLHVWHVWHVWHFQCEIGFSR